MPKSEITLDELYGRIEHLGQDEIILDVREPDEYSQGHIPGSMNLSHNLVTSEIEKLKAYKKIYIHCRAGGRAKKASETLESAGFDNVVCVSDAGMDAWKERGYPVETE